MARLAKNPALRSPVDSDNEDDGLQLDTDQELDALVAQARNQGSDDRSFGLSSDDFR